MTDPDPDDTNDVDENPDGDDNEEEKPIESHEDLLDLYFEVTTEKERREVQTRLLTEMLWKVIAETDRPFNTKELFGLRDDTADKLALGERFLARMYVEGDSPDLEE